MSVVSLNSLSSSHCRAGLDPNAFRLPPEVTSLLQSPLGQALTANIDRLLCTGVLPQMPGSATSSLQPGLLPRFDEVGKDAKAGAKYGVGPKGRPLAKITRGQYAKSFQHPVALKGGSYLFQGKLYSAWDKLAADMKDGRVDGYQTSYPSPPMNSTGGPGVSNPGSATGSNADAAGNAGTDFLHDPSLSLEEKLMILMAKLASDLDKKIEEQMDAVQAASDGQKSGAGSSPQQAGASSSGSAGSESNLQVTQMKLQQLIDQRNQFFSTFSNMMKSLNDTSKAIIANLRA